MERRRILPVLLTLSALALACLGVKAQTDSNLPYSHVRKASARPMPFPPESSRTIPVAPLEFRAYEQMSRQDRDLAADGESSIEERAGFVGLEFNQGKWSYQQMVCPALPNHLLLQFTRNNGIGDVSVFSASIPRNSDGRVRIIPILRRGYSLFSPAPINALTISAFNHIRAEERSSKSPDWLGTGLCYAALAGTHPQIGSPEADEAHKVAAAPPGRLVIPLHGGAEISFVDVAALPRPTEWSMTFNGKGKLLKATHSAAPKLREAAVPKNPTDSKAAVVPPSPEVQGRPVSQSAEAKAIPVKAESAPVAAKTVPVTKGKVKGKPVKAAHPSKVILIQ